MKDPIDSTLLPNSEGFFGDYGGRFVPEMLVGVMEEITKSYLEIRSKPSFRDELTDLLKHYVGRPSPIFYAENLTRKCGGAKIYFKREDLNHTGAHKINHCLGEALVAKHMGKKKIIAETGAGQHGVALATAAAHTGLECDIYMGEVDIEKERPNVLRMQILGARVIPVSRGLKTLKDAVDAAFEAYVADPETQFYAIGSVVGPHPFPMMVRDFQEIVGIEARDQFKMMTGGLPDMLVACVGGGSNAIGLFTAFLNDAAVRMIGVESSGRSFSKGEHAATLTKGKPGMIHGYKCYLLQENDGSPSPVYSIASGLDYPGVGPEHCYLKDLGRVEYVCAGDDETVNAFFDMSRIEGIIPALESAHAIAHVMKVAPTMSEDESILVNLSGRGDKDIDFMVDNFGHRFGID